MAGSTYIITALMWVIWIQLSAQQPIRVFPKMLNHFPKGLFERKMHLQSKYQQNSYLSVTFFSCFFYLLAVHIFVCVVATKCITHGKNISAAFKKQEYSCHSASLVNTNFTRFSLTTRTAKCYIKKCYVTVTYPRVAWQTRLDGKTFLPAAQPPLQQAHSDNGLQRNKVIINANNKLVK